MTTQKRVAVVIGSGSVKCAAALGLQNVLAREGIEIDMLVGCSGGSLYAALMAAGYPSDRAVEMSKTLWTREITSKRNTRSLLKALFPKLMKFDESFGMRDDGPVFRTLEKAFGGLSFETMKIPLHIAATDFHSGEQVVLSSGGLVDAIRASIAIPFIFPPWRVGGRLLVDGFLSDPLPVGVAMKEGADVIIAMGFESPYQTRIDSPARFAFQVSSVMTNNLLRANYAFHNLAHHSEVIPIVPVFSQRIRLFDTEKIPAIVADGERAAEEQIPYLKRLLGIAGAASA
ncbi:MAG TPA: patatin-like phospholipase family protein [Thermoanaerobaculia bacterium]|nr:patatin-like phospholipase family protein [Thermoanaerobaculia bacterium]